MVAGSIPAVPATQVSRRAFLAGALVAPVVARAFFGPPRGGWPTGDFDTRMMRYIATERYAAGWVDPRGVYGTEFRKILQKGLNEVFAEEYAKHPEQWEGVFDDGISLTSTPHPGTGLITEEDRQLITEEDRQLIEADGWKCVNGHPYCNRCASPVLLSEESLEQMVIDIQQNKRRWFR